MLCWGCFIQYPHCSPICEVMCFFHHPSWSLPNSPKALRSKQASYLTTCSSVQVSFHFFFLLCFIILRILTINITWFSALYFVPWMLIYSNPMLANSSNSVPQHRAPLPWGVPHHLLFFTQSLVEEVVLALINSALCVFLVSNTSYSDCSHLVLIEIALKIFHFLIVLVLCLPKFSCYILVCFLKNLSWTKI